MPFISSGSYGCIFKPYVKCANRQVKLRDKNVIGKIFENDEDLEKEREKVMMVQVLDPKHEFTLPFYGECDVTTFSKYNAADKCEHIDSFDDPSPRKQLLYAYGGKDLLKYMEQNTNTGYKSVLKAFIPIIEGVNILNNHKISHLDIKPDNIVYDGNRLYLIDFGMLSPTSKIYKLKYILDHDYPFFPPEFKCSVHNNFKTFVDRFYENFHFKIMLSKRSVDIQSIMTNTIGYTEHEQLEDLKALFKSQKRYSTKVDVYALGIVLTLLYQWSKYDNTELRALIKQMIRFDPNKRVSIKQVASQYSKTLLSDK